MDLNKIILFFILLGFTSYSLADSDRSLILVNGSSEKTVEPNMVLVQIESWAKAAVASQAQEVQAAQYVKLKTAIDKFKIKKEDIQTTGFSVFPEYTYDQKTQVNKISGYKVSHRILVVYKKVSEAGVLIDSLVSSKNQTSGVSIQSVSLDYDNKSALETTALADAVKNARVKAEELATAAGVSIKGVHKIQHSSSSVPPIMQSMYEGAALMEASDKRMAPTDISSGQIKVRVDVQMEFEI